MKTDFDKFRKWRRWHKAIVCVLVVLLVVFMSLSLDLMQRPNHEFIGHWRIHLHSIVGFIYFLCIAVVNIITLCIMNGCLRCPYCGKLVMSKWLGRDAAGLNCAKRIVNRQTIQCVHCGQEIDTE